MQEMTFNSYQTSKLSYNHADFSANAVSESASSRGRNPQCLERHEEDRERRLVKGIFK